MKCLSIQSPSRIQSIESKLDAITVIIVIRFGSMNLEPRESAPAAMIPANYAIIRISHFFSLSTTRLLLFLFNLDSKYLPFGCQAKLQFLIIHKYKKVFEMQRQITSIFPLFRNFDTRTHKK